MSLFLQRENNLAANVINAKRNFELVYQNFQNKLQATFNWVDQSNNSLVAESRVIT